MTRGLGVMLGLVTACAQLLDLPSDPQVVEEPAGPTTEGQAMTGGEVPGSGIGELAGSGDSAEQISDGSEEEGEGESVEESGVIPVMGGIGGSPGEVTSPNATGSGGSGGAAAVPAISVDAGVPTEDPPVEDPPTEEPPTVGPPTEPCGLGESLGPNGRCYIAEATSFSWARARQSCRQRGADWDLASVRDVAVNRFLAELVDDDAWIGASDAEDEGTWVWVDDGTPFWNGTGAAGRALNGAFTNWTSDDEPSFGADSDDEPNGGATSDCGRIRFIAPGDGILPTWGDFECDEQIASVCEGPPR